MAKRPTSGPAIIYLDPVEVPPYDRTWCEDDDPNSEGPWIKYVRADLVIKRRYPKQK